MPTLLLPDTNISFALYNYIIRAKDYSKVFFNIMFRLILCIVFIG